MKNKIIKTSMESLSPILLAMLEENIDVTITVTGNSMYPLFMHKRDSVILTRCNKYTLKTGDIALYKRDNGQYVLHRIVKVNKNSYDLCGDHQYLIEKKLPKEKIIAVVKAFERKGKRYSCDTFAYGLYWRLWVFSMPYRSLLYSIYNRLRRIA